MFDGDCEITKIPGTFLLNIKCSGYTTVQYLEQYDTGISLVHISYEEIWILIILKTLNYLFVKVVNV